jgi:hypothetical protein
MRHELTRLRSFYVIFCEETRPYFMSEGVLTFTIVTSAHKIIIFLSAKVGTKSGSASEFGLESSGTLSWTPDGLTAQQCRHFLETVLLGLHEDVPLAMSRGCGFSMSTSKSMFMQSLSGLSKISWQDLKQLRQRSTPTRYGGLETMRGGALTPSLKRTRPLRTQIVTKRRLFLIIC